MKSIRSKLFLVFLVLTFIPTLLFYFASLNVGKTYFYRSFEENYRSRMDTIVKLVDGWLAERQRESQLLAQDAVLRDSSNLLSLQDWLVEQTTIRQPRISHLVLSDAQGNYITDTLAVPGTIAHREYFQRAMDGRSVITAPVISQSLQIPVFIFPAAIRNRQNDIIGMMGLGIELERFRQILMDVILANVTETFYLLDQNGLLLAARDNDSSMTQSLTADSPYFPSGLARESDRILLSDQGFVRFQGDEGPQIAFHQVLASTEGFHLILVFSEGAVIGYTRQLQGILLVLMLLVFLTGALGAYVLSRRLSQPLVDLRDMFDRGAQGDLTIMAAEHYQDEIGQVGQSFNRMMQTIRNLTYYDSTTELPNRNYFQDYLKRTLENTRDENNSRAVIIIALDKFKYINDSYGSTLGDWVLKEISQRLVRTVRGTALVSRGSGAEFVLFCYKASQKHKVVELIESIMNSIAHPLILEGEALYLTASVGVSFYPDGANDAEELISSAGMAKTMAKKDGGNRVRYFDGTMRKQMTDQLHVEVLLHEALNKNEFYLMYQPQVDVKTRKLVGMEALIRWNNGELGLVSPARFIPLAEETGLIGSIGTWVLNTVCQQAKDWLDNGLALVPVAVNVSAWQFDQEDFIETVQSVLLQTGLPVDYLELEITESVAMGNVEEKIEKLQILSDMGLRISIDDFGTGFSSLSYLKRFPINTLKIDQSFIRDIPHNHGSVAITDTVIAMGRSFHLEIVAEGVETIAQLEHISQRGCQKVQGYLFSKPLETAALEELLRKGGVFEV